MTTGAAELRALRQAAARRRRYLDASEAEREAIVAALRAGIPRKQVVEVSTYTPRQITTIQTAAGLTRRQRKTPTE